MANITKTYTFSAGSTIIASEHNTNFDTIYNEFNGSISNVNISGSAAIAYSKLTLSGEIVNSDIATNAAIAGSKLNPAFASIGSAVLAAGILTSIANTSVGTDSLVYLTTFTAGGTVGVHYVSNITAGVTFNINSSEVGDTSTVGYLIVEP